MAGKAKSKRARRPNVYVQDDLGEISSGARTRNVITKLVPGDRRAGGGVLSGRLSSPTAVRQNVARADLFTKNLGLELRKFLILTGISAATLIILAIVLNLL